ncbi:hypothetical protein EB796_019626 [Bugula neritina]|uniref:Uncharacterized protein n=1 Tax=Bugula neritina TaxID=10212 RepID=A0A7J7J806_BUGNE|nr:hypothetical protein EB796_019626 [Bugula neritina]
MAAAACGPSRQPAPICPPDVSDTLDVLQGVETIATRDYARGVDNDHINFVAMDTQSGNRVLLTLYYHKENHQLLGLSKSGKTLFIASRFSSNVSQLCSISLPFDNNRVSGTVQMDTPPHNIITLTNYAAFSSSPNFKLVVKLKLDGNLIFNRDDKVVAKIAKSAQMFAAEFYEPFSPVEKCLILVHLMRRQFFVNRYQDLNLTPKFGMMPIVYVPVIPKQWTVYPIHRDDLGKVIRDGAMYYIRVSNYCPESDTYYLDIINEIDKQVYNTVKVKYGVDGGKMSWVNNSLLCFVARGVAGGEALHVTDASGDLLAYKAGDQVYDNSHKLIAKIRDPVRTSSLYLEGQILSTCYAGQRFAYSQNIHKCVVVTRLFNNISKEMTAFALAWAIRNCFTIYKLQEAHIPRLEEA